MGTAEISKVKLDTRIYSGIRQLSVFLDGRQKTLDGLLKVLHTNKISIVAFSSQETRDYLVLRIVSNYSENLKNLLLASSISFAENNVLAVEFFHGDDVFKVVGAISAYEIKIHYMYPMLVKYNNKIGMIMRVEDVDLASKAVHSIGLSTISQEDIDR
ncbi:MAG: hypothetical protein LBJ94_03535 [Puniceicoccales bacterium]|jgi:hypothetical protein|nr:hypothetical protein [Puniceicoccales bacterium]